GEFVRFLEHQLSTFCPCDLSYMVEMGIHHDEALAVFLIFEDCPSADAWQCGIPSFVRLFRVGIRQPEGVAFDKRKAAFLVKDCRMFAFIFSVIATYTYCSILGKQLQHVFKLVFESFLNPQQVEIMIADELTQIFSAVLP